MVDSCLHVEPYTKEELCKFFELSVGLKSKISLQFVTSPGLVSFS